MCQFLSPKHNGDKFIGEYFTIDNLSCSKLCYFRCEVTPRIASCLKIISYVLGWPKSLFSFFCKIKDTFFIFTSNFIDLDILSMSAICR